MININEGKIQQHFLRDIIILCMSHKKSTHLMMRIVIKFISSRKKKIVIIHVALIQ